MTDTASPETFTVDLKKLGSPSCDTGAQTEGLRIMGLDAKGKPLNGKGLDFDRLYEVLPQLFTTDAAGKVVLKPQIDIATLHVENKPDGKGIPKPMDCFDKLAPDGQHFNSEVLAAVVAAGQVATKQGIALKDVKIESIVNGMKAPLEIILHLTPAMCKSDGPLKIGQSHK